MLDATFTGLTGEASTEQSEEYKSSVAKSQQFFAQIDVGSIGGLESSRRPPDQSAQTKGNTVQRLDGDALSFPCLPTSGPQLVAV